MIHVLVADGSRIHTQLLADALKRDPGLEVIPFNSDVKTLVSTVKAQSIDVLVISSSLDGQLGRGFDVLRELRAANPAVRALILMDSSTDEAVLKAFRAGARGVLSREEPVHILSQCVRRIHEGQIWANSRELTVAIEALATAPVVRAVNASGMSLLSKRELQIVRSLAEGLTNREIAERLKLSQHTVKNYLFRVFDKLGVSSRVELLFMTMSEPGSSQSPTKSSFQEAGQGSPRDEFASLQKAADAGLPAAQLALSQLYLARHRDPQDLVYAYTWHLIATQGASQAKEIIARSMTPEQIEEAQKEANAWLGRLKQSAHPTSEDLPNPRPLAVVGGATSEKDDPRKTRGVPTSGTPL